MQSRRIRPPEILRPRAHKHKRAPQGLRHRHGGETQRQPRRRRPVEISRRRGFINASPRQALWQSRSNLHSAPWARWTFQRPHLAT